MLENHQSLSLSFFGEKKRVKPVDPAGSLAKASDPAGHKQ
jgi:hypothetical protein